jgi:hypothetical protein
MLWIHEASPLPSPFVAFDAPGKFDETALKIRPVLFLFSDEEIEAITDEERRHGRYTLARLPAQKHQSILVLLKERRSFREIARLVSVAPETVQAVARLHADARQAFQRRGANNWAASFAAC